MTRQADFERMRIEKREYHVRLRAAIDKRARDHGRTLPNRNDYLAVQREMDQEYLAIVRW